MNKSNNDLAWDCLVDILDGDYKKDTEIKVLSFIKSYHKHKGKEVEFNFSNDNWQLVFSWIHIFKPEYRIHAPVLGHHSLHPIRFLRFLFMKLPIICTILFPIRLIISIEMILSATIFARRTKSGALHTSGLLLDIYLCKAYSITTMLKILEYIIKKRSWISIYNVFRIYHGNLYHYNYKVFKAYQRNGL